MAEDSAGAVASAASDDGADYGGDECLALKEDGLKKAAP